MSVLNDEINCRRTFGIISHPDAGKTTLTEKLLLFGGAINTAGAIKAKKSNKYATSDFMEIEKQRGISVATSVMGFVYNDIKINLLDTPGHEDFCEDTYRTLTAVDSAVMVIDCSKGVEIQTEKLLEVCRMRNTPVITFINKLDREGLDPIELLDEVESKLKIKVTPLSWPIGMGRRFRGVYNIYKGELVLYKPHSKQDTGDTIVIKDLQDKKLDELLGDDAQQLRDDIDLLQGVYPEFDLDSYRKGITSPVFFGSAVNNFGVKELLNCFIDIAPVPGAREAEEREVLATEDKFSGFIFKIHANMDPRHRDRIAFLRVCSGVFMRNKSVKHVLSDKLLKFSNPTAFMAQDKEIIDSAYPGDIVGLHDTGKLKIGDTLSDGESLHFLGIPSFSPEIFRYMINSDPMKSKQLNKGIEHLTEEGLAQVFTMHISQNKLVGTVGALQFEVIQHRLLHEYGAACRFENVNFYKACWIKAETPKILTSFIQNNGRFIAFDKKQNPVYLAESRYFLQRAIDDNPEIKFYFTSDFTEELTAGNI